YIGPCRALDLVVLTEEQAEREVVGVRQIDHLTRSRVDDAQRPRIAVKSADAHDSSPHTSSITPGYIAASGSFDPYRAHSKQKVPPSGSTCCAGPPHDSHSRSRSAAQRE